MCRNPILVDSAGEQGEPHSTDDLRRGTRSGSRSSLVVRSNRSSRQVVARIERIATRKRRPDLSTIRTKLSHCHTHHVCRRFLGAFTDRHAVPHLEHAVRYSSAGFVHVRWHLKSPSYVASEIAKRLLREPSFPPAWPCSWRVLGPNVFLPLRRELPTDCCTVATCPIILRLVRFRLGRRQRIDDGTCVGSGIVRRVRGGSLAAAGPRSDPDLGDGVDQDRPGPRPRTIVGQCLLHLLGD